MCFPLHPRQAWSILRECWKEPAHDCCLIKCSSSVTCHIFTEVCKLLSISLIVPFCSLSKFSSLAITLLSSFLPWNYWWGDFLCVSPAFPLCSRSPQAVHKGSQHCFGREEAPQMVSSIFSKASNLLTSFTLPRAPHLLCLPAFTTISPTRISGHPQAQKGHWLTCLSHLTPFYKIRGKCSPHPYLTQEDSSGSPTCPNRHNLVLAGLKVLWHFPVRFPARCWGLYNTYSSQWEMVCAS